MHIAIVEDNPDLRTELEYLLTHSGYTVTAVSTAADFYRCLNAADGGIDVVLLDLGLPDEDGLSVARKIKGIPGMVVIMLTARGHLKDRVDGLESGADAYLTKPVNVMELIAVIESVTRRVRVERGVNQPAGVADQFSIDSSGRRLFLPDGNTVSLTRSEGVVIKVLSGYGMETVSRRSISEALGQDYMHYDERRLEAIISRLRKKLRESYPEMEVIKAARGIGYQLLVPVEQV
ncbi:response regulator transcription factor [Parendozoicomonas haliclonae]|uniref:Virulence transcriptional regulatory protein PhoP n=1 Tax=Parendozoicomonas haliclonae TaxID=1960125 RepID=A0A1X7AP26_9GAMM|nr:response regulator transcription factor [Parendozoicomonas haliclonae]SMA50036.1 Virulence transcriptional regulatory protein PhoP [Parendozoicomonas haliclonae]